MFRIRRIYDDLLPVNQVAIEQVRKILRAQFDAVRPVELESLGERLQNPFKHGFRCLLTVAERRHRVLGCALVLHDPNLNFCFLDYLAAGSAMTQKGIGGALYEAVREQAKLCEAIGLFFECPPDDPSAFRDPALYKQSQARLRFYEQYGARPVSGTDYQRKIKPGDDEMPLLVYDGLDAAESLRRKTAKAVVRAILEKKYAHLCPPDYVQAVVESFRDDPVQLRPWRYVAKKPIEPPNIHPRMKEELVLVVNDRHDIHHVRERGYVESPVRIKSILGELKHSMEFTCLEPRNIPRHWLYEVHDRDYVDYLQRVCARIGSDRSVYPYVFPIRNRTRPPRELSLRAGYYCIDTFTPLNGNAWLAARRAVDCTLTAAAAILDGRRFTYSLVRPPGHHAERHSFGGFCYLNNNAIAANFLSKYGKVAILDLDYHHGNGQQDIFYQRSDVLTQSIHGHPDFAYPYFSGFADEQGAGAGLGFNVNYPLAEHIEVAHYKSVLRKALAVISNFAPDFLVIALGLDTTARDPTGSWALKADDLRENGRMIGDLGLPTLVVQEGGYRTRTLGVNAAAFLNGVLQGVRRDRSRRAKGVESSAVKKPA